MLAVGVSTSAEDGTRARRSEPIMKRYDFRTKRNHPVKLVFKVVMQEAGNVMRGLAAF